MENKKMLGDFGTRTIDDKGRIWINKIKFFEKGESVALLYSIKKDYLTIYKATDLHEKLEELTKLEEMDEMAHAKKEIILAHLITEAKIDASSRLKIPASTIQTLKFDKTVFVRGGYDHLRIYSNQEVKEEEYKKCMKLFEGGIENERF